jgi:O-antigen ligase
MPRFTVLAAGVGVSLIYLIATIVRGSKRVDLSISRRPVFLLWLGYLIAVGFSCFVALNRSEAMFDWLRSFVIFSFFLVLVLFLPQSRRGVTALANLMAIACGVLVTIGTIQLVQIVSESGLTLESTYQVHGLSGHRNLLSQTLLLTVPFAAYCAVLARGLWRAICSASVILALILMTGLMTRSVWVAAAAAGMATGVLLLVASSRRGSIDLPRGVALPTAIGAFVIGGTVLVGSMLGGAETFKTQLAGIARYNEGNAQHRLYLWGKTGEMIVDHPFLGVGAGNWKVVVPRYTGANEVVQGGWKSPRRPHNDLLWVLAETGVIGLGLYVAIFSTFVWWAARGVWIAQNREQRIRASAVFFAIVGYLVFSLFSFPRERIEHSVLLVLILVMALFSEHELRPAPAALRRRVVVGFLLATFAIVTVAFAFGVKRISSETNTMKAYSAWNAKQYEAVVEQISRAYSTFTTVDRSAFPLLFYRGEALSKLGQIDRALEDYQKAYSDSPFTLPVVERLAVSCAQRGDPVGAERYWKEALDIDPQHPKAVLNLAYLYTAGRRDNEALEILRRYDSSSNERLYLDVLLPLLRRQVGRITSATSDQEAANKLHRNALSDTWLRERFTTSIRNSTSFADEVLSSPPAGPVLLRPDQAR